MLCFPIVARGHEVFRRTMSMFLNNVSSPWSGAEGIAKHGRQSGWRLRVKSTLDRAGALCGIIVSSPLLIGVGLAVWLTSGRPILFRQQRPGRFAKPFVLLKFRTMSERRNGAGKLMSDGARLTRIGRILRSLSLDEVPQLWNVVKGDLSLVGPRPLLMDYLPRYSEEQARRHDVMPGITGWAQANGRNALTWEQKFALDVWYVDNWSIALDLRILLLTVIQVPRRVGISQSKHATMGEFLGSDGSPRG